VPPLSRRGPFPFSGRYLGNEHAASLLVSTARSPEGRQHDHCPLRRGGSSVGKAISLIDANAKTKGTGTAKLWEIWKTYKDVAHLVMAAVLVARRGAPVRRGHELAVAHIDKPRRRHQSGN
jgi:hypothetical protein